MLKLLLRITALILITGQLTAQTLTTADKEATPETQRLFINMKILIETGTMFGHQDALAYGMGWKGEKGRSDIKSVTDSHPAVYGWDLAHLELDSANNIDGVPFKKMRKWAKDVYKRGGINTYSWHAINPVNGQSAWDTSSNSVKQLVPGGEYHEAFKKNLDKVAGFLKKLKKGGKHIPVIFRPYHEHTGSWFWWGQKQNTAAEYKALWQFTVNYLKNEKGLHHLLYSYSTADFKSDEEFLERYPGDDYIDMMGFDIYQRNDTTAFLNQLNSQLQLLTEIAKEHKKLPALTEVGFEQIPDTTWWTVKLLPALLKNPVSYVLLWRNERTDHYYVPYPGQISTADFIKFYKHPKTIFQDQLTPLDIYTEEITKPNANQTLP